jgi:hypothetical protein
VAEAELEVDAEQRRQAAAVTQQQVAAAVEPPQQVERQQQVEVDAEVARPRQPDRLTPWLFDSRQPESS